MKRRLNPGLISGIRRRTCTGWRRTTSRSSSPTRRSTSAEIRPITFVRLVSIRSPDRGRTGSRRLTPTDGLSNVLIGTSPIIPGWRRDTGGPSLLLGGEFRRNPLRPRPCGDPTNALENARGPAIAPHGLASFHGSTAASGSIGNCRLVSLGKDSMNRRIALSRMAICSLLSGGAAGGPIVLPSRKGNEAERESNRLDGTPFQVLAASFSPDGKFVVAGGTDGSVKVWEYRTGRVIHSLLGRGAPVFAVGFSSDGTTLASGGVREWIKIERGLGGINQWAGGAIDLWDLKGGRLLRTFDGHSHPVFALKFWPGDRLISALDSGHTFATWDVNTGRPFSKLERPGTILNLGFSPSISTVFSANASCAASLAPCLSSDRRELLDVDLKLWITASQVRRIAVMDLSGRRPWTVALNANGSHVAVILGGHGLTIWETSTQRIKLQAVTGLKEDPNFLMYSPDGTRLVSGEPSGSLKVWDAASGKKLQEIEGPKGFIRAAKFLPDEIRVVSGGWDQRENRPVTDIEPLRTWHARFGALKVSRAHAGRFDPTRERGL